MSAIFRRDSNTEIAPGTIIAEFGSGPDALAFCRMKGDKAFSVTAGINHMFAVRKRCEHPVKHIRADEQGMPACTLCGQQLTESAARTPSGADGDPQAHMLPVSPAGASFTLHALTERGRERLPDIERLMSQMFGGES